MKLHLSDKKKLVAVLALSGVMCLGSTIWLGMRVYEISDYFGTGEKSGVTPEGSSKEGGAPSKKAPAPPPSPSGGKKSLDPVEYPVTPTATGSLPVTTPKEEGVIALTTVELPADALDWTKEGKQPVVGDIIRISIPEVREYRVKVEAFEIVDNRMIVSGSLVNEDGECIMIAIDGVISIRLVDRTNTRVFNLFFHAGENKYTVEEIDPTLIPPMLS